MSVQDLCQRQVTGLVQDLRKGLLEMQTQGHKFDPMGWPTKMLNTEPKCDPEDLAIAHYNEPDISSDTSLVLPCLLLCPPEQLRMLSTLAAFICIKHSCTDYSYAMQTAKQAPYIVQACAGIWIFWSLSALNLL